MTFITSSEVYVYYVIVLYISRSIYMMFCAYHLSAAFIQRPKYLPAISNSAAMILVTSVGKVHPGNVHAGVNHLNEKIDFFGGWTNCTYDSGQPYPGSFGQNVQAGQIVHGG